MANTKQITVIIPVHEFNENVKELLVKAVESVNKDLCEIMFVGPNDVLLATKDIYSETIMVVNNGETDPFNQINKAVLSCVTPYFTVLEFDDTLLPSWENVLVKELGNNTITMSINEFIKDGKFTSFGNEIVWDAAFIREDGELGFLTEDELKTFSDFNVTGSVIKTEDFISLGSLKPEFKLFTWYEFLMRVAKNNKPIYIVPRVCYSHTILRDNSFMVNAQKTITNEEANELIKKVLGK